MKFKIILLMSILSFSSCKMGLGVMKSWKGDNNTAGSSFNGTWLIPKDANSNEGVYSNHPEVSVASNKNGFMVATWARSNDIMVAVYKEGVWSFPQSANEKLNINTGLGSSPKVAVNNKNEAIVVWKENNHLIKAEYKNNSWSKPTSSSEFFTTNTLSVENFEIGYTDSNRLIAAFTITLSGKVHLFKVECESGTCYNPSSTADHVSLMTGTTLTEGISEFQLKVSANGDAFLVWSQKLVSNTNHAKILVAKKQTTSWSLPVESEAFSLFASTISGLKLEVNSNGHAILVWSENSTDINVKEFTSSSDKAIFTITKTTNSGTKHHLSINDQNEAVVTWIAEDLLFKAVRDSNLVWSLPLTTMENVNRKTVGLVTGIPSSKIDENGNIIIAWVEEFDDNNGTITRQILKAERRSNSWSYPDNVAQKITPDNLIGTLCSNQQNAFISMAENNKSTILISTGCSDSSISGPFYTTLFK